MTSFSSSLSKDFQNYFAESLAEEHDGMDEVEMAKAYAEAGLLRLFLFIFYKGFENFFSLYNSDEKESLFHCA